MKQPKRIFIMGLPGAGKTYFAEQLRTQIKLLGKTCGWINADEVRRHFNDWDFSIEGRIRQSLRMKDLAAESNPDYCIVDFVAPLVEMRNNFDAEWTIWIDTIKESRFEDTNKMFVPPTTVDFRITEQNAEYHSVIVAKQIVAK